MAGGRGTRMGQLCRAVNKHLLPVHDKPMVFYPLSLAIQSGCKRIVLISNPEDLPLFKRLLGNGRTLGIRVIYQAQTRPGGVAEGPVLAATHWRHEQAMLLLLGDNLFLDPILPHLLRANDGPGATCVLHHVSETRSYGRAALDAEDRIVSLDEKPPEGGPGWAVTGAYVLDRRICALAASLERSHRNELEILDLLEVARSSRQLRWVRASEKWIDMGTPENWRLACQWVEQYQQQGTLLGSPELAAALAGFKTPNQALDAAHLSTNEYQEQLRSSLARYFPGTLN